MEKRKIKVTETGRKDYPYNVQIWTMTPNGWTYAGIGRYCRSMNEVETFMKKNLK